MRLHIENFARIGEADITIDGITVIAGENNTGKSTVGKILFSLFNSLCNVEVKILDERLKEIEITNRVILQNYASFFDVSRIKMNRYIMDILKQSQNKIKRRLEKQKIQEKRDVRNIWKALLNTWQEDNRLDSFDDWKMLLDELSENTWEILSLPENKIMAEVIGKYFNNVFYTQMNSLSQNKGEVAKLELEIRGKKNEFVFLDNRNRSYSVRTMIAHKAIYIDNPFIIDELSTYTDLNPMGEFLKELLTSSSSAEPMDGIIETLRAREKMSDIYEALGKVVDGDIEINKAEAEFYLSSEDFDEPISFHNLSTGLKSFVILKMLLEKGGIKEKDVIILDEPEIHLHPQWQIAYAELIVLLQKYFDLSTVVTTHSPYFVDAINLFTRKYGTDDKANYYLSANDGNAAVMENVSDHIDMIYTKMASPIQMLDTLRHELNNQ